MRQIRHAVRLQPGGTIHIPNYILRRLGVSLSRQIEVNIQGHSLIISRPLTNIERRTQRLRERVLFRRPQPD